jgi:hypothetical protein
MTFRSLACALVCIAALAAVWSLTGGTASTYGATAA